MSRRRWQLWERQMDRGSAQQDRHDTFHAQSVKALEEYTQTLQRQIEQMDRADHLMDRQEQVIDRWSALADSVSEIISRA